MEIRSAFKTETLGFSENQKNTQSMAALRLFFVTARREAVNPALYAALHEVLDPRKNIVTAEGPVEFKIDGINQVAVRPDIGLTFASVLRFLRQIPTSWSEKFETSKQPRFAYVRP